MIHANVHIAVSMYVKLSCAMTRLLCRKFESRYPLQAWRQGKVSKNGAINQKICYSFHGDGCTFKINSSLSSCLRTNVDVDYLDDAVWLDPWKVSYFLSDNFGLELDENVFANIMEHNKKTLKIYKLHSNFYVSIWKKV